MDLSIFDALNMFAGHGIWTDRLIVFFGSYLQYVIGLVFVIAVLWPVRRYRLAIAAIASALVARLGVKTAVVLFVHRARPYVALEGIKNVLGPQLGEEFQSFPSGHAVFFFALAMAAYLYDRRLGWWLFAGATIMGVARVIGGIHWPSDILGGAVIGILTAWLMVRFIPALRPRV
ncbi:MAG TPA: phosphatase PAP2 family protein [Candidatus Paceibacterota bacterium]|nr:phosphatase PAP2 family protein [Candidatus Paceibacterota bacterium]